MKEITHEEVKKLLIEMLPRRFSNSPSSIRKFTAHDEVIKYVRQQEKKDKLLDLYREKERLQNYHYIVTEKQSSLDKSKINKEFADEMKKYKELLKQIKTLEEELEEMNKKIIGWYPYTVIVQNVGVNGEQYGTITNYEPIFEGETQEDAKIRLGELENE